MSESGTAWREPFTWRGVDYTIEVPNPLVIGAAIYGAMGNEFSAKVSLVMGRLRRGDDVVFRNFDAAKFTPDDLALVQAAWLAVSPFTQPTLYDLGTLTQRLMACTARREDYPDGIHRVCSLKTHAGRHRCANGEEFD